MSMKEGMYKALYAASRTVESGKQLKRTLGHPPRRRGIYEIKPHDDNERHKHYDIFSYQWVFSLNILTSMHHDCIIVAATPKA